MGIFNCIAPTINPLKVWVILWGPFLLGELNSLIVG
jgi:hypothetical protein